MCSYLFAFTFHSIPLHINLNSKSYSITKKRKIGIIFFPFPKKNKNKINSTTYLNSSSFSVPHQPFKPILPKNKIIINLLSPIPHPQLSLLGSLKILNFELNLKMKRDQKKAKK
jgi:hypothetical protein